jgi:geranylgeranyl pyrophosphate synthase
VSETQCSALASFGHHVGLAFQLIDDALDYTGSVEIVGKATHSDLLEGKVTLPVILLRTAASSSEWERVRELISQDVDTAAVTEIAALVDKYDTANLTVERAHGFTMKAMAALHSFPAGPARDHLENLANKLLFRFN